MMKELEMNSEKNQNDNWISHIRMCQKYTSISEISRILLKICYKFHQHHCVTYWFTMKKQIIQINRIIKTDISKNKRKIQEKTDTNAFWLWKISYHWCRCIKKSYENIITTNWWARMKIINCMLHMKTNINKTMIQYSW